MDTKSKIIHAAINVFGQKGKFGAKMEEIAAVAGVNKAMVYYYFRCKCNLLKESIRYLYENEMLRIGKEWGDTDRPEFGPEYRIKEFINIYYKTFAGNAVHMKFLLYIMTSHSDMVSEVVSEIKDRTGFDVPARLYAVYKEGVSQGIFRDIDYTQVMVSVFGMMLVFFLSKPMTTVVLDMKEDKEKEFLEKRKESIMDLLFNGIKIK